MTEYAIQAKQIVKKFGDFTAIEGINLNVPKGSIYGFLGSPAPAAAAATEAGKARHTAFPEFQGRDEIHSKMAS